jgi:hypothetical protein
MPGYWFLYNFYALARNAWKYIDRDKRIDKTPIFEYNYLAPDSVNELINSLDILAIAVAKAAIAKDKKLQQTSEKGWIELGKKLLHTKTKKEIDSLEIFAEGFENSKRKTRMVKVYDAYHMFEKMILVYGMDALVTELSSKKYKSIITTVNNLKSGAKDMQWTNVGGQLMPTKTVQSLINQIKTDSIGSWEEVHEFYQAASSKYPQQKIAHALAALEFITGKKLESFKTATLVDLLDKYLTIKTSITDSILYTRSKDYKNPFRKMVYENEAEMNKVIGNIDNNSFILEQQEMLKALTGTITDLKKQLKTK